MDFVDLVGVAPAACAAGSFVSNPPLLLDNIRKIIPNFVRGASYSDQSIYFSIYFPGFGLMITIFFVLHHDLQLSGARLSVYIWAVHDPLPCVAASGEY